MFDFGQMGFDSLADYQKWHGLSPTGVLDGPTQRSLNAPRVCGLPDRMDLGRQTCMWSKRQLTCAWAGKLPGISDGTMNEVLEEAWEAWMAVCGIRVTVVTDPRRADVVVTTRRIDGANGVLAQAELPCGQDRQRPVEIDVSEPWVTVIDPPRYRVSAVLTLRHEFGHTLGLGHGPPGNLMQSIYDSSIKGPQSWDISSVQQLYGPPVVQPAPRPEPSPEPGPVPADEYITIPSFRLPKSWLV